MLTDEQKAAAQIALLPDINKVIAYQRYMKAITGMDKYGLPFRIYLDYLKAEQTPEKDNELYIEINPLYPLYAGYPTDKVLGVCFDDFIPHGDIHNFDEYFSYENLKPEKQREVIRIIEPLFIWHINDDKWKYYFLHFLNGYDIEHFTEFDFYGVHGQHTKEDINLLIHVYSRYQNEYMQNPQEYYNDNPVITIAECGKYTDKPFYFRPDKEQILEREQIIAKGINGYEYTDEEYFIVYGTTKDNIGDISDFIDDEYL